MNKIILAATLALISTVAASSAFAGGYDNYSHDTYSNDTYSQDTYSSDTYTYDTYTYDTYSGSTYEPKKIYKAPQPHVTTYDSYSSY